MKRIILLLLLMSVIIVPAQITTAQTAPAQTVLTDVWMDKDHGALKKIAVFWIVKVSQNRLLAENEFVRQLKSRGITAMPAYVVIPPDKIVERDVALTKIRELGVDAILILRLSDKQTIQSPIPQAGPAGPSRLSDYYQYVYDAPVRDESELTYLETNLFEVKTERRIWTARSVTKVNVVDQKALADFITIMIDRLVSDRMLP
jgi:hypothetical protein